MNVVTHSRHLLIVYGGQPDGRTDRIRRRLESAARSAAPTITVTSRHAFQCTADDLLRADGIILGTPEHFGYMSGALKDFFDRTFYPVEGQTLGRPYALFVSAGNDGSGTVRSVERIVSGYGWRSIAPALIVKGDLEDPDLIMADELGATMAVGLESGIF